MRNDTAFHVSPVFFGKVIYVHRADLLDVVIDLGFNVSVRKTIKVRGMGLPGVRPGQSDDDKMLHRKAKAAAFSVILDKKVLLMTEKSNQLFQASVFIPGSTDHEDVMTTLSSGCYIDYAKYMAQLRESEYSISSLDIVYEGIKFGGTIL